MRKFFIFLFLVFSLLSLSGCEDLDLGNMEIDDLKAWIENYINGNNNSNNDKEGFYTLYLDTQGLGSLDSPLYGLVDRVPADLPEPTPADGYRFEGWYYDTSFENPVTVGDSVNRYTVLYARFVRNYYTMTFVYDSEVIYEFEISHGDILASMPTIYVPEGYVMMGWGVDGDLYDWPVTSDLILEPIIVDATPITIEQFKQKADSHNYYFIKGVVSTPISGGGIRGSYILSDNTGHIFVYAKSQVELGDEVLIAATYQKYNEMDEVVTIEYFELLSKGNDYMSYCQEVFGLSVEDMSNDLVDKLTQKELSDKYCGKYLKITGIMIREGGQYRLVHSYNGRYYVTVYYTAVNTSQELSSYINQVVDVYGFCRGCNGDSTIIIQPQRLKINTDSNLVNIEEICDKIVDEVKVDEFIYDNTIYLHTTSAYLPNASLEYYIVSDSTTSYIEGNTLNVTNINLIKPEVVTVEVRIHLNEMIYYRHFKYTVNPVGYTTINEFIEKNDTIGNYIIRGYVLYTDGSNAHIIADETATMFAYFPMNVEVGDEVLLNAIYQNYYGAHEIGTATKLLEVLSKGNDVTKYFNEPVDQDLSDWVEETLKEDFDSVQFGDTLCGKLLHFKGYVSDTSLKYINDKNGKQIVYIYQNVFANTEYQKGDIVEVWAYCRGIKKSQGTMNVTVQVIDMSVVVSDAEEITLLQFHGAPDEYMNGKKVKFEGIITEKIEDGLFVATQVSNKKEYSILVEGDYNIGDKYCFIGNIEYNKHGYKLIKKQIPDDEISADIIKHLTSEEYIILDSNIPYEEYYGASLYSDGVVTNCVLKDGELTFYLEATPYVSHEKIVVLIVSVEIGDLAVDTSIFIGKTISGKFYRNDIDSAVTHLSLDLNLIIIR